MDHRDYTVLMKRYHALNTVAIAPDETRESLIKKLMDISYEKKQIANEANAIIREYILRYEEAPQLLDAEAAAVLDDFFSLLIGGPQDYLDLSVSLRISKLLLCYYQSTQDLEQIIRILRYCARFDLLIKIHTDEYEGIPYALMAERYLDDFDQLSDKGKYTLARVLANSAYNRKDPAFGLRKYGEIREIFEGFFQKMGDDPNIESSLALFKAVALTEAVDACSRMEYAQRRGVLLRSPTIDLEAVAPIMEELCCDLEELLASERAGDLISERVAVQMIIAQARYHMGKMPLEELLARIEACAQPREDYDPHEQSTAQLYTRTVYLEYLCKFSDLNRRQLMNKSMEIIRNVLDIAEDAVGNLKEMSQFFGAYEHNRRMLELVSAASSVVEFDFFKRITLNVTVYADKALYVHTMMVKEISLAILRYIIDHDPEYLDGVAGYDWEYCADHKQEIFDLMENCALFHDIGKYFCLDVVSNASRNLTDDEFGIIQHHPYNFSNVYNGDMSPAIRCIRDCAELHHRWYNEAGGYPREKHTVNKPFVNILTIADCVDAATDNIGRPYGLGKTFEQVRSEFDRDKDTRYSGYISELLHVPEIQAQIEHIINEKRKDIYCDIYLSKGEKAQM